MVRPVSVKRNERLSDDIRRNETMGGGSSSRVLVLKIKQTFPFLPLQKLGESPFLGNAAQR